MQILVTGSNGQLGNEFRKLSLQNNLYQFTFIDFEDLDLTDIKKVEIFFQSHTPEVIINCAAYTAVDKAEQEKELATEVNANVPGHLAKIAQRTGAKLVHISTDYIFSGTNHIPYLESDQADPQSAYAVSKFKGEQEILKLNLPGVIIRTSWLYSEYGTNFVKTILKKAREINEIRVIFDQIGSPTYALDLANLILNILPEIIKHDSMEVYHYSNEGIASWYDFAQAIIEISGIQCKVLPIETSELKQTANRPYYSVLNKSKIRNRFGISIPYWRHSLKKCLDRIQTN
jgi:dTDP-4-dehydrorhamnose reductase